MISQGLPGYPHVGGFKSEQPNRLLWLRGSPCQVSDPVPQLTVLLKFLQKMFECCFFTTEPQLHSFKWLEVPVLILLSSKKFSLRQVCPTVEFHSLFSLICTLYLLHPFFFYFPPPLLFYKMSVIQPTPVSVNHCPDRMDGNMLGMLVLQHLFKAFCLCNNFIAEKWTMYMPF